MIILGGDRMNNKIIFEVRCGDHRFIDIYKNNKFIAVIDQFDNHLTILKSCIKFNDIILITEKIKELNNDRLQR